MFTLSMCVHYQYVNMGHLLRKNQNDLNSLSIKVGEIVQLSSVSLQAQISK